MDSLELSEKYEPLFEWLSCLDESELSKVDTVVVTGGRYSQKSFAVGTFTCVATKDYNHRVLYTRYTLTSAKDSIIPEFNEKIDLLNCSTSFEVTNDRIIGVRNESKIVFKGIKTSSGNQTANLKSLKGFSIFVLEEAEEMPDFESWDKIKKSIRALDVRNLNVLILNPATKTHWIFTELFEDKGVKEGFNGIVDNILYIHTSYLDMDRKYIPDSIYLDFEDKRKAYEIYESTHKNDREKLDKKIVKKALYYKHVVLGGWLDNADGVIFDDWEYGVFDESLPYGFGQDFGFSNDPTTLTKVAVDKKRKIIYADECYGKAGMSTDDIYEADLRYAGFDKEIIADSAEPRLISEVKAKGINIKKCIKGPGSVTAGIKGMQGYKIIITNRSAGIAKELNNYVWHDKKSGTPVDLYNHFIDGIRYYAYPLIANTKKERTVMQ